MRSKGFTLIELMIVVVVVAVLSAIALPMYNEYIRRATATNSLQEIQKIADQLERHKSKNFSYKNFNANFLYQNGANVVSASFSNADQTLTLPLNATGSAITYTLHIRDGRNPTLMLTDAAATGKSWVILAEANSRLNNGEACTTCNSLQQQNSSFLMSSSGVQCKTKLALKAADTLTPTNLTSTQPCGAKGENW
ncbi:type IV pilin protein [Acinetobacter portensis]|nr:prepilin-type N-terminal cleavage/methylation domain-containing protein [Acinetobacter portensis]